MTPATQRGKKAPRREVQSPPRPPPLNPRGSRVKEGEPPTMHPVGLARAPAPAQELAAVAEEEAEGAALEKRHRTMPR